MRKRKKLSDVLPLDTPFTIAIDIVSLCNFKCRFCFHSIDKDKLKNLNFTPGFMDYDLFTKAIDQIAQFPGRLKKLALYMRGEPLLHKKLPDMISYAKKKKVAELIQVTTNGSLLSPKMNLSLSRSGLDELVVSVEALSSDQYKALTGFPIDFDKFTGNISDFYHNKGQCNLYIKILDVGLKDSKDKKKFYKIFSNICDKAFIEYTLPQYQDVSYEKIKSDFKTDVRGDKVLKIDVCTQPFLSLYILHNGDVCVCCVDYKGKIVFGNVEANSLLNIWQSENLKKFRVMQLKKQRYLHYECKKCSYPNYNTPGSDILDNHNEKLLAQIINDDLIKS